MKNVIYLINQVILMAIICLFLSGCSGDEQLYTDNINDAENNIVLNDNLNVTLSDIYIVDGTLSLAINGNTIEICKPLYTEFAIQPNAVMVNETDERKDICIYYAYRMNGYKSHNYYVYLVNYDIIKNIASVIQLDNKSFEIEHEYCNDLFFIRINHQELKYNIEEIVNKLQLEPNRFDKSISEIMNDEILISEASEVGIKDYNSDGKIDIIVRYDLTNKNYSFYITSLYLIRCIENDNIILKKAFLDNLNNKLLSKVISDGFVQLSGKEVTIDSEDLLKRNIIKNEDSRLVLEY